MIPFNESARCRLRGVCFCSKISQGEPLDTVLDLKISRAERIKIILRKWLLEPFGKQIIAKDCKKPAYD